MSNLDTNAWFYPEGGYATHIGITGSQIDVNTNGNSLLQLHVVWNPGPIYGVGDETPTAWSLSGGTVMWNTMQMQYGTVEAKIKFTGTGTHPALWLFDVNTRAAKYNPSDYPSGDHHEIDIAECLPAIQGNTTTLRFGTFGAGGGSSWEHLDVGGFTDYSTNFHVYKVVWNSTSVTFYVDGVQQYQTTTNVPTHPMYLVMDIECGDAGAGAVSQSNFPGVGQVYQVDYVKAWDINNNLIFYDEFNEFAVIVARNTVTFNNPGNSQILPSAGNPIATTGTVASNTATVHGDLNTNIGTHVIIDNPA